ncbi:MAG: ACP S-malonyltransferase [Legionellaceae bacterium]|nr:ACP S-malonyltransferase [Legionellaceae bacterium]MBP9774910.1 ACP S-malonyltransferase [Legionellaceae bacterium]
MINYAIVFPGQGSQFVGMLTDLAEIHPEIKATFSEVSDHIHYDVWQMVQHGPEDVLNQTEHTQVAMLTADVALFRVLQHLKPFPPKMMAGHSLGEYAALVGAEVMSLVDAAKLVQTRGRLMQQAIPLGVGAMAAIVGLTDEQVRDICLQSSQNNEQVTPANYNAIGQVVIAGHIAAVQRAMGLAETHQAKLARLIPVSVPCHCALLKPAAEKFADALAQTSIHLPKGTVISNVDLSIYHSVEQIRALLQQQLYSPVRWVETIQMMQKAGVETIIECGPGKVLSGLIKRIDKSLKVESAVDL